MRTPADIQAAFLAVLKSDAAGAAVRAQLVTYGSSAASIIEKEDLNKNSPPTPPILVLAWGPSGGGRTEVQRYTPTWWLYDAIGYRWVRLTALVPLIRAAYPKGALVGCEIDFLTDAGETTDRALNMRAKSLPLTILTR